MKAVVIVLAVVAIVAAGVAGYAVWKIVDGGGQVPNVVGVQAAEAERTLADAGYVYVVDKTYSDSAGQGQVARQEPAANARAAKGTSVTLWVSEGGPQVAVPDVAGSTVSEADATLAAQGLNATAVAGTSGTAAEGQVYREVPVAGTQVPRGSVITIYYNGNSPTVQAPSVVGLTLASASHRLRQSGLLLGSVGTHASKTVQLGTVMSQSVPATEPVGRGTKVSVVLSGGPPAVLVPDVLNMGYKQAEKRLQAAGFEVRVTWVPGTGMSPGAVVRVNPRVGTPAPEGSVVVISVEDTPLQ